VKIQTFDSSVLSTNSVYTEVAWKVDVANLCPMPLTIHTKFRIFGKDEFELDSASQAIYVAGNGVGNARGRMLVSPPERRAKWQRRAPQSPSAEFPGTPLVSKQTVNPPLATWSRRWVREPNPALYPGSALLSEPTRGPAATGSVQARRPLRGTTSRR
jgi:hypothetical protein